MMKQAPSQETFPLRRSFWLRCWQVRNHHRPDCSSWRFSLEDAQTGQKMGFMDMQSIVAFLVLELGIEVQENRDP